MQKAPIPNYEDQRLCAVFDLKILDTAREERFDLITQKAVNRFFVPISTITIVDKDREWYKSAQGLEQKQDKRDTSFCGHAMLQEDIFIVEDTKKDERFKDNLHVIGVPFIRFYAGKSLYDHKTNLPIGVFCIKGYEPKKMTLEEISDFLDFAKLAEEEINKKAV